MSTYYSIACKECRVEQNMVSSASSVTWMYDAPDGVLAFLREHLYCGSGADNIEFFSEHDRRYDDYTEFKPEPDEAPSPPNIQS